MKKIIISFMVFLAITSCFENSYNCPIEYEYYSNFKISTHLYSENIDLDSAIKSDYGEEWRMADWQDLLKVVSIHEWANEIGLQNDSSYHIKNNGKRYWSYQRSYFITLFVDYDKPNNFLAHDNINNNYICLGS